MPSLLSTSQQGQRVWSAVVDLALLATIALCAKWRVLDTTVSMLLLAFASGRTPVALTKLLGGQSGTGRTEPPPPSGGTWGSYPRWQMPAGMHEQVTQPMPQQAAPSETETPARGRARWAEGRKPLDTPPETPGARDRSRRTFFLRLAQPWGGFDVFGPTR